MSVDLWTVVLTIISFYLLYFLLNTFLFRPLMNFMDARKARINAGLDVGEKARQAEEENNRLLDDEMRKTGEEVKQIIANAKAVNEEARSNMLAAAKDAAAAAMKEAKKRVEEEEKAAEASVEEGMQELVAILVARLLPDDAVVSTKMGLKNGCVTEAIE